MIRQPLAARGIAGRAQAHHREELARVALALFRRHHEGLRLLHGVRHPVGDGELHARCQFHGNARRDLHDARLCAAERVHQPQPAEFRARHQEGQRQAVARAILHLDGTVHEALAAALHGGHRVFARLEVTAHGGVAECPAAELAGGRAEFEDGHRQLTTAHRKVVLHRHHAVRVAGIRRTHGTPRRVLVGERRILHGLGHRDPSRRHAEHDRRLRHEPGHLLLVGHLPDGEHAAVGAAPLRVARQEAVLRGASLAVGHVHRRHRVGRGIVAARDETRAHLPVAEVTGGLEHHARRGIILRRSGNGHADRMRLERLGRPREHLAELGHVVVVERHARNRALHPARLAGAAHVERPALRKVVLQVEVGLRSVVERHEEAVVDDGLPRLLHRTLHRLRSVLREDQVLGVFGVAGDHLPHEAAVGSGDHQVHAVGALARVGAGAQFPRRIDRLHLHVVAVGAGAHRELVARRRQQRARGHHLGTRAVLRRHAHGHLATHHRRLALHLGAEVDHAADDQDDDAGVDHPHAQVHDAQRDPPQRGGHQVGRQEPHEELERPPVEPLELGHLERTPLPELGMHPRVRVEDVRVHRVENARRTDRHVDEEERQQDDPEPHAAEEVKDGSDDGVHGRCHRMHAAWGTPDTTACSPA